MTASYDYYKTKIKVASISKRNRGLFFQLSVKKRRCTSMLFGVLMGFIIGFLFIFLTRRRLLFVSNNNAPCFYRISGLSEANLEDELPRILEKNPINLVGIHENESDYKGLVFVGVMTAQKYLSTRAVAVYETWGRELAGKIAFFSSQISVLPPNHPELPLIPLRSVDDSYPPQKKSFLMLQYMYENFGNHFEYFLRADDDVYIHPDKLEFFLRSIDSSKLYYIGQAGRGNQKEFGLLSLEYDENFCMGGPGVIISRETLAKIAPHIKDCLKNLYTTHEDVELGRCVRKYAGISCTWSYEMQTILYHNSSGEDAFTGNLKLKEVHRAITLHPVKQHNHMYRIHNYMRSLKIHDLQQKMILINRDILNMMVAFNYSLRKAKKNHSGENMTLFNLEPGTTHSSEFPSHSGIQPGLNKFKPKNTSDVLKWEFISRSMFSDLSANPRKKIHSALREGLDDVVREVMESINQHSKQRGRIIEFRKLLYGYHRVNPLFGADYVLDMLLMYKKYRGRKMTVPVRRHAYLQQQFTSIEMRESSEPSQLRNFQVNEKIIEDEMDFSEVKTHANILTKVDVSKIPDSISELIIVPTKDEKIPFYGVEFVEKELINFILPLSGRHNTFRRFLMTFEKVCLKPRENVSLYVILFPSEANNTVSETLQLIKNFQGSYPSSKIIVVPVFDKFARAMALDQGAQQVTEPNDLLFFIDVDMTFTEETLARVRLNTKRGESVYFPIVFSEFDRKLETKFQEASKMNGISQDSGYWRQFGFGIASLYKTDLIAVGSVDTSIKGWGKEDVDLYTKFITSSTSVTIFRTADPSLVHRFHLISCSSLLEEVKYKMCKDTRYDTYKSMANLASILLNNSTHSILKARLKNKILPPS